MSFDGFTAGEIQLAHNATLDLYIKGPFKDLGIDNKPLLKILEGKAKPFGAAKEKISYPVRLVRGNNGVNDSVRGFSHDETVGFYNPTNGSRVEYIWREHHIGISMTESELKTQGLIVDDEGGTKKNPSDRAQVVLADILETKNSDWMERRAETLNLLLWGDGVADPSSLHGVRAFIPDIPTIGVVGGISAVTYQAWRNRARTAAFAAHASFNAVHGGNRVTSNPANGGALLQALTYELRQLTRYGGSPDVFLAGSDFLDALERERRANGQYSQTGFTGAQDVTVGDTKVGSRLTAVYDPTLDAIGRSKFGYIFDSRHIVLRTLEGDWKRFRTPARPFNQFVLHKSCIDTGQLCCMQRDSSLVIEIA